MPDTAITTKPFRSRRQWRWAFATGQPFARRWAHETPGGAGKRYRALPGSKDAGADAGAPLHGPGGLLATPGGRKWGRRAKATQIAGNLFRGDDGKFQAGGAGGASAPAKPKRAERRREQRQARDDRRESEQARRDEEAAQEDALRAEEDARLDAARTPRERATIRREIAAARRERARAQQQARRERQAQERAQRAAAEAADLAAEEQEPEKEPAKGGGGGGSAKPSDEEKRQQRAQERAQRATETLAQLAPANAIAPADLDALRQASLGTPGGTPRTDALGLTQGGQATDQGRRALAALERGDVAGYEAAVQDARAALGRANEAVWRRRAQEGRALARRQEQERRRAMRPATKSTFAVFKDARGAYRWISRTTTAYRDRDGEIISVKALEADAARMTATGQYGPLRYWHVGTPDPFNPAAPWGPGLDIGDCDYSIVLGRTSIESGTFKSAAIGRAFAKSAADYELSPGFFHPPDQPDAGGVFMDIRRFERSTVPVKYGRASNLFTGLTVKEQRMDQAVYEERVKAYLADMNEKGVPPDVAAAVIAQQQQSEKTAETRGIAYKSDDAPQVYTAPDGTPGIIHDGRFVALKAAAPPDLAEVVAVEEEAPDEPMAPMASSAMQEYLGDMDPGTFWGQLDERLARIETALNIETKMGKMFEDFKTMLGGGMATAQKEAGERAAEIAAIKEQQAALDARLKQLEGDQPAVTLTPDALAALKSDGPQARDLPDPSAPVVPHDPTRPFAAIGARLSPELYSNGRDL